MLSSRLLIAEHSNHVLIIWLIKLMAAVLGYPHRVKLVTVVGFSGASESSTTGIISGVPLPQCSYI